jgi:hypothetical protein
MAAFRERARDSVQILDGLSRIWTSGLNALALPLDPSFQGGFAFARRARRRRR